MHQKKQETNCLIKLTGKSAKLKCRKFSTYGNHEIKMPRNNSVLQYIVLSYLLFVIVGLAIGT